MSKISIIGLGYVGLPLAQLFATKYSVVGYDINVSRLQSLRLTQDLNNEVTSKQLEAVLKKENDSRRGLYITDNSEDLIDSDYYIITVPTPIDHNHKPDLSALLQATELVASNIKTGAIVILESTVYPGLTEEVCIPLIENVSGLSYNRDFFMGYSPERINPGDKTHTIENIVKITSGSTEEIAQKIDQLYKTVIKAGTYLAPSIKVAEAAKVIENTQRDINIAFVNELAKIFSLMGIDTGEVLKAARTKWNFISFTPGLVGGHCIGVDPYYLAEKAQQLGYHPEIILAGRKINDSMGAFVAAEVVKLMSKRELKIKGSKVLILGITFKENCPDVRNTRVIDIIKEMRDYGAQVEVYDPQASVIAVKTIYNIDLMTQLGESTFDAIILAVAHREFEHLDLRKFKTESTVVFDVKGFLGNKADKKL